mgnify:CR=1 FL=1|jgi:hypothetical protein|tara:strand:- start:189 stop:425 length:237 start_codon:yes stop_codon:yes gene_type:complete
MIKSNNNKLGAYIQKLMTTVLDKDCDDFVRNLALSELSRINVDIKEFILNNEEQTNEEEHREKELLTEEKKNGKRPSK